MNSSELADEIVRRSLAALTHRPDCGRNLTQIQTHGPARDPKKVRLACPTCGEHLTLPTGAQFVRAWGKLAESDDAPLLDVDVVATRIPEDSFPSTTPEPL